MGLCTPVQLTVVALYCALLAGMADGKSVKTLAVTCPDVTFVTRAEWGARPPKQRTAMSVPVGFSVVHHTATKPCTELSECEAAVRSMQNFHMDGKGWSDIGYNFLIGGDERVYIGRGWDTVGAHAGSSYYNRHSIGVSVIGNYMNVLPSPGVIKVLKQVMECGVKSGYLRKEYVLRGHRDVRELGPTDCPGDKLYQEIRTWPHYLEDQR